MRIEKVEKIAREALGNAFQLFRDSVFLFKSGSFSTAAYLSIIAVEELGKFISIDNFVWHNKVDGKRTAKETNEFLLGTYNHRWKQAAFTRNHHGSIKRRIYNAFASGNIEDEKQKCLYVGLSRNKSGINEKGRVFLPKTKTRTRTEELLNFSHYLLIDQYRDLANTSYDETIRGFKLPDSRNKYKDLFYMWDLNYRTIVLKRDWEYVKVGFNQLNKRLGIRHVD